MLNYGEREKRFFKRALILNVFPKIESINELSIGPPMRDSVTRQSYVRVSPWLSGAFFFKPRNITYSRFNLKDYKVKTTDDHLEVPASRAENPQALVNYMNEIYLHSVNTRVITDQYDILRGMQIELTEETLKTFDLSNPVVGQNLLLEVQERSYLFEGSLKIKFI
jgi:hypothetical protein